MVIRFNKAYLLLLMGLLSTVGLQQKAKAQSATFVKQVEKRVAKFGQYQGLQNGVWSFGLWDVETGKPVYAVRPNLLMTPASTIKVLTTGAILDQLGPDFRYTTTFKQTGKYLIVEGDGDPSLGSEYCGPKPKALIDDWVTKLTDYPGLTGSRTLVADLSVFETTWPDGYQWVDLGNYFGAGPRGLNWMDNMCRLSFNTGKQGDQPKLEEVIPAEANTVNWINQLETAAAGTGDNAYVYGLIHDDKRLLKGTLPEAGNKPFVVKAAMPSPELVLLTQLEKALQKKKTFTVDGKISLDPWQGAPKINLEGAQTLFKYQSPQLEVLVTKTNQYSLNHFADAFLLKLGASSSKTGTYKAGLEKLEQFLVTKMGLDKETLFLVDGSGLSADNAISAANFGKYLVQVANRPWGKVLAQSFSIAGGVGTFGDFGKGTAAQGNLAIKTGSITRVQNYIGYFKGKDGRKYAVVLMTNKYTGKFKPMRQQAADLLTDLCSY